MYTLCKTAQSAKRQRELEFGLLEAMTHRRFDEISVSDLCDAMEIPRKSFYRYFSGKDGALHALIDHTLMEYETVTASHHAGHVRSVHRDLESFFRFWLIHRKFLDALVRSEKIGVLIERAIAFALTDEVMPTRFLPYDAPDMQRQIVTFGVCGLMSIVLNWQSNGYAQDTAQLATAAVRMLSKPLFPNAEHLQ